MLDATANFKLDSLELSLANARVLVIGSGQDIDGRDLGETIDNSDRWNYIVRINKLYGDPVDSGRRTDIFVTRWSSWVGEGNAFVEPDVLAKCKKLIILNQNVGYSKTERDMISKELGLEHISAGVQAVAWLLNRGCQHIDLIGFGYKDGKFNEQKVYAKNSINYEPGMVDTNPLYSWAKEREWLLLQPQVTFI